MPTSNGAGKSSLKPGTVFFILLFFLHQYPSSFCAAFTLRMGKLQCSYHCIVRYKTIDLPVLRSALTNKICIIYVGLLKVGVPQPWEKSKKNLRYVRKAGVRQFISHYKKVKELQGDELQWGDEVEYGVFHVDKDKKEIRLSLRAKEVSIPKTTSLILVPSRIFTKGYRTSFLTPNIYESCNVYCMKWMVAWI